MTIVEMLSLARSGLKKVGNLRYRTGTTTATGATDGSTLVSTSFGGADDAWNEAECRITESNDPTYNQRRMIVDWVNSTGTMTVEPPFTHQIGNTVTFEVGERGFISDHQLMELFTDGGNDLLLKLPSDAFTEILETKSKTGVNGIVSVPTNIVGLPHAVKIGGVEAIIFNTNQEDKFTRHAYLGTADEPTAIYKDGSLYYKPTNKTSIKFEVVPVLANTSFTNGSPLPTYLHPLQVKYAVMRGWQISQRLDLYESVKSEYNEAIKFIIAKYEGEAKQ